MAVAIGDVAGICCGTWGLFGRLRGGRVAEFR